MQYGFERKRRLQIMAVALAAIALVAVSVLALLVVQWTMRGTGSIKGVGLGVYWDQSCTNPATSLDFGRLEPGSSKDFALYLRNEGNSDITLSMTAENWNPANAAEVMTLTWNREGQKANPDQIMNLVITLFVSQDVQDIKDFSMDIIISGTA